MTNKMSSEGMMSVWKGCCINIPQRWIFAIMGFLGLFNAYAMRSCLSITITEMTRPTIQKSTDDTCVDMYGNEIKQINNETISADYQKKYDWDEPLQGLILSSFYYGYVLMHLPGAYLANRYGGKYTLGIGILLTAVFTLMTHAAVEWGDAAALIVIRVLMGLGEGTTYPAVNVMLAKWTPPEERSKIGSFVYAGAPLGTVYATTVSGLILRYTTYGWPAVFYFFGTVNVMWFCIWMFLCYDNPKEHPFISEQESKFLNERMNEHTHEKPPPEPWRHILSSKPLWALIAALIGHNLSFMAMVSDLPKYMSSVLKFSIQNNGYLSSLAYLCMWIGSLFSSWLADWTIAKKHMSVTNVRKLGATVALIMPSIFIVMASYVGCDRLPVVVLFFIGMTFMGAALPGIMVNVLDLSPNYAGTLMALTNGLSALTGIVAPSIVGFLAPDQTLSQWRNVFWIMFGVSMYTQLIFLCYGNGKVEYWNDPDFVESERKKNNSNKIEEIES